MRAYWALFRINLRLTLRDRVVLFFNYVFPLLFFFAFAEFFRTGRGSGISYFVGTVLTMGILGNGLWGAGMRSVQEREANILRRFKVTPITPLPILLASMASGWLLYLPVLIVVVGLAHLLYGMPLPQRWFSLVVMVSLGVCAFRALGLILGAVTNTMQEATVAIQLLYMPMLLLSGATVPAALLPAWAQTLAEFLPASYLVSGFQGIFFRGQTLADNALAAGALAATIVTGVFLAAQLFRWEKGERIPGRNRLWVAAVLAPFLVMGGHRAWTREHLGENQAMYRELQRSGTYLIRGARILTGAGGVVERGAVLVRDGRIGEVYPGAGPEPKAVGADPVEAAGKTLLPGLIDVNVRLSATGGAGPDSTGDRTMERAAAALLYSGVTAAQPVGDPAEEALALHNRLAAGKLLGARLSAGARQPPAALLDDASEVPAALERGSRSLGYLPMRGALPEAALRRMAKEGIVFVPALAAAEAQADWFSGRAPALERSLVEQTVPVRVMAAARELILSGKAADPARAERYRQAFEEGRANLLRAWRAGVPLAAGSGAGAPMVFHGPALHRELQLWVEAGIPARAALEAATLGGARLLGIESRTGSVEKGRDADLLLLDGNPLQDIAAVERISLVICKGERVRRSSLFDQK